MRAEPAQTVNIPVNGRTILRKLPVHANLYEFYRGLKVATSFLKAGRCLLKEDKGE